MAALRQLIQNRESNGKGYRAADIADIDSIMRKVFDKPAAPETPQPQKPDQPRRDFETAFDLLDRAAAAVDHLLTRCQRLETEMQDQAGRAKAEADKQQQVADQWKTLASGMKAHAEETERRLEVAKTRCEAAEARATAAEQRAAALQAASDAAAREAAAAAELSTEFHDKVFSSFGFGSRAHMALEAVAKTTDQTSAAA